MLTFTNALLVLFGLALINYLLTIYFQKRFPDPLIAPGMAPQREGFTDQQQKETFLDNTSLYDEFYASVYDQLSQQMTRTASKVALVMQEWQKKNWKPEEMTVLDAGCGTGVAAAAFTKMKVKRVLCLDTSQPMLNRAEKGNQLNKTVDFRKADLMNPSACSAGEFTHAACFYFTLYYLPDIDTFFRNMYLWVKPGGEIAIEVVNKYKFDPMLESASPWLGFSLQKYAKKRVTESNVTFDKFVYSGKFDLYDPNAEFRETFRFKDGTVRRQKHKLTMPTIEAVVKSAQASGWTYIKFHDLVVVGFEYAYILFFRHP